MNSNLENIDKVCQVCFQDSGSIISCLDYVLSHRRPADMLMELCPTIKNCEKDEFPMLICDSCTYSLDLAYDFKLKCLAACSRLRSLAAEKNSIHKSCYYIDNNEVIPNTEQVKDAEIYDIYFGTGSSATNHNTIDLPHNISTEEPQSTKAEPTKREILDELLANHKIRLKEENSKVKIFKQKRISKKIKLKSLSVPEQCNDCGKIFKYSGYLKAHSRTHTGLKPFECKYCEKKFAQSGNLALHIKTHTKEKNFQCEICSKFFTTTSNLSAHQKTHSDVRNFHCNICSRSFKSSSELTSHAGVHTGIKNYKCKTCNKAFYKVSYLNSHIRTVHFKQKKYKCNQCNKEFSNSSNLNCHYRIHTGEKPYACKYCAAKFNQSSALTRHTAKKHLSENAQPEELQLDDEDQVGILYDSIPSTETPTANITNLIPLNIQTTNNYTLMEFTKMITTPQIDKNHLAYTNNDINGELVVNPCIDFSKNSMDTYVFNA